MGDAKTKTVPPLWGHQVKALEKLKYTHGFALFMDPGTGKTRVIAERLENIIAKHPKVLIICPPVVIRQWREELLRFTSLKRDEIVPLVGTAKKRVRDFLDSIKAPPPNMLSQTPIVRKKRVWITNYEALLMEELFNGFMSAGLNVMVLDESHRIKNPTAKRTRQALRLGKIAAHRYILTGSPILRSIEDIYTQIAFIDPNVFGKNFYAFRHTYMWDANRNMPKLKYFPDWRAKPGAEAAINRKIKDISFSAKKSECLDLPPFLRKRVEVEMTLDQSKAYHEMKKQFITYVRSGDAERAVVAELAITKTLRMRQILSGFVPTAESDGLHHVFRDCPRLMACCDILEDVCVKEKVIVWCEFRENYSMLAAKLLTLGIPFRLLVGDQTEKEREKAIWDFRNDPEVKVLISNPGAGGIGINLVEASHMIYYSRSPSLEHDIQSEARAYRGGSEVHEKVTRWDLVCAETLDDVVLDALLNKKSIGDAIVGWASLRTAKENPLAD